MKFPQKKAINVITKFSNLPHRFQIIHKYNNISWINDSKSTNVANTEIALKNIQTNGTIRLLIGGDSKFANFNILNKYFQKLKIKIYCFGKDGYQLSNICQKKSIYLKTINEIMNLISKEVVSGDIVILSPGCSSQDQFSNFEERGNLFTKLSKEIR